MPAKLLLVGCGLTSALTASLLSKTTSLELTIWEKARGVGGRMATSRSPSDPSCTADLGAQYFSRTPQYETSHRAYYDALLAAGVLEPLALDQVAGSRPYPAGTSHFVAGQGSASVVRHFLNESGCRTVFSRLVQGLTRHGDRWMVNDELFDGVVLTMPIPQVLQLGGDVPKLLEEASETKARLERVRYSSRFVLALFYEAGVELAGLQQQGAAYISDDAVFRFVSVDSVKRNRPEAVPSVVLHTSVPFGVEHIDKTVDQMEPLLMDALRRSFPQLPPPKSVKCHKWRYSQVSESYEGQPGAVELSDRPLLLVAGDGLTHSNFDGCVASAEAAADAVRRVLLAPPLSSEL